MIAQVGAKFERITPQGDRFDSITLIGLTGPTSFSAATTQFGETFEIDFAELCESYGATSLDTGISEADAVRESVEKNHKNALRALFGAGRVA